MSYDKLKILRYIFYGFIIFLLLVEFYYIIKPANQCSGYIEMKDSYYKKDCLCLGLENWNQCRGPCVFCNYEDQFGSVSGLKYRNLTNDYFLVNLTKK